jgi:hypothetical protein
MNPSDPSDVLLVNKARDAEMARQVTRAAYRAIEDARARARLDTLTQTFLDMLRQQPDVWGNGFDPEQAAELTLPIIERLIRE